MSELESISFFKNPPNIVTNLTALPELIASFTIHSDQDDVVKLIGNIGWLALVNEIVGGVQVKVDVIFEIWRGPVTTGTLIYSARDSAQASNRRGNLSHDNFRITTVAHVDDMFTSSTESTYSLSARLGTAGTSAVIITEPITFYGEEIDL